MARITENTLIGLISAVYEAGMDASLWTSVLSRLAEYIGGVTSYITVDDLDQKQALVTAAANYTVEAKTAYEAHFVSRNVWQNKSRHLFVPGHVVTSEMACPRSEFVRSEYYNDFLKKELDAFHSFGAVLAPEPSRHGVLAFLGSLRPERYGPFENEALDLVRELTPHVERALRINIRIGALVAERDALAAALQKLSVGIWLVNRSGELVFANRRGADVLRLADGLSTRRGKVECRTSQSTNRLRAAITAATDTSLGGEVSGGCVVRVPRVRRGGVWALQITPLARAHAFSMKGPEPVCLVAVSDPSEGRKPGASVLQQMFGLTGAEARIAVALAAGATLAEVAELLNVTMGTVRWHLKSVMAKLGVSKQSQLVSVVAALAVVTPGPDS